MERFPIMSDGNININDVLDAIETTDPSFAERNRTEVDMISGESCVETRSQAAQSPRGVPYVEIIEQPASKALRFRYECEGRSAGSIPGVNSTPENKTFPSIRIVGYKGRAIVVVSCVTKDPPYRPHPHKLVGKEVCRQGVCTVEVSSENMTVSFDKLGIQCAKRIDIEEALKLREEIRVDPFRTGFEHKRQPTSIDLNAVRLCFQIFLEGQEKGKFTVPLQPTVSEPIYDKKAMSDLVICKLSHCSASVVGGTEMVLLCEKVAKEDIQVRFFEEREGHTYWEGFGDFQPTHVHKQVAIAFRTPSYKSQQIEQPVQAYIQLRRPSDGSTSEPLHFQFLPLGLGRPGQLWSLRKTFARKKATSDFAASFNRVTACDEPKPRFLDHYNNNNYEYADSPDSPLGTKRAHGKLEALRALHEIYIGQRSSHECESEASPTRDLHNNNNSDKTVLPETYGSVHELKELVQERLNAKSTDDWFDYTEVGKWVEKSQQPIRELVLEENSSGPDNGDKCLNELLSQVVELDKIYEDTHDKLLLEKDQLNLLPNGIPLEENGNLEETDVDDDQTYTSLQLAMKNPVWVRVCKHYQKEAEISLSGTVLPSPIITINSDKAPPRPPPPTSRIKRDVILESEERLPPLPPKRIRKTPSMPVLPRIDSTQASQIGAPHKNLPIPPNGRTCPKQHKPGLFSKLFFRKGKKNGREESNAFSSTISLPGLNKTGEKQITVELQPVRPTSTKSLNLQGEETPPYEMDLTEAEHYALYTDMAPHATTSEFDEMSFYYSPVEGGKIILEDDPDSLRRKRKKSNNSPNTYMLKHVQAEAEKYSTSRTIKSSDSELINQLPRFNFNLIKSEPSDRLSPFGGASVASTSPTNFQVANTNSTAMNFCKLRPIQSPERTPSPMECSLYNIPPTQSVLTCRLQPMIPQNLPSSVLVQETIIGNLSIEPGVNYPLGDTSIISNAIGNAINIGSTLDTAQQTSDFDLNFSQFDNVDLTSLNISDIVKEAVHGEEAVNTITEESCMTDSFTKLTRNTIQELCSLNNMYKPTRDDVN